MDIFFFERWLGLINTTVIFIASSVAVWLGWRKVRTIVSANYSISGARFEKTRIDNITLYNEKDKNVIIWNIYAIINKEICITLKAFEQPLIIKPYEVVHIATNPFSQLYLGEFTYDPDYIQNDIEIAIKTGKKIIFCRHLQLAHEAARFRIATTHNVRFDDIVITDKIIYILIYFYKGTQHTALIDKDGYIGRDWVSQYNMISEIDDDTLKNFIALNFDNVFTNYECHKVNFPEIELLFRKPYDENQHH